MGDISIPIDYDLIELAFLLKSIGFQLKSFEFCKVLGSESKDIEIDLSCHASGFKTKFVLSNDKCTCPPKPLENNNSFWEVQGKSPSTPNKDLVQESSCTLLPDINKKTMGLARSTLLMLLQHYRNDLATEQKLNSIKDITRCPESMTISKTVSPTGLESHRPIEDTANFSSTPVNNNVVASQLTMEVQMQSNIPRIKLEHFDETEMFVGNPETNSEMFTSPKGSQGISSVVFPSPQLYKVDNDREVLVIESISRARKELDAALIHLKCNITRDLSDSSILTKTPSSNAILSNSVQNTSHFSKRRASLGSGEGIHVNLKDHDQFQFPRPQSRAVNGPLSSQKIRTAIAVKNKVGQPDTPRPPVDLKQTVVKGIAKSKMLRSVSSTALKGATTAKPTIPKQKSALPVKKT